MVVLDVLGEAFAIAGCAAARSSASCVISASTVSRKSQQTLLNKADYATDVIYCVHHIEGWISGVGTLRLFPCKIGGHRIRAAVRQAFMFVALCSLVQAGESTTFFRGLNLNGLPVTIDGNQWEGADSKHYDCHDKSFENQSIPLTPATDAERTRMIRSSRYGGNRLVLNDIPSGHYSVLLYVWEDNDPESYQLTLNGRVVAKSVVSGTAGSWQRLGPWSTDVKDGTIVLASRGGAANFSGVEIWKGDHDGSAPWEQTAEGIAFFESRIRPLLVQHCYECHRADSKEIGGELLVDSRQGIRQGGGTGPAVVPGDLAKSLLIQAVSYQDKDLQMPPEGKLSDQEIADLKTWVEMGAPDPRSDYKPIPRNAHIDWNDARNWWSLKPLHKPAVPEVQNADWPNGGLDRFVLARMESEGLSPATDTDKRTWIRRVTYDLVGLPPTPQEVEAFLADESPVAYEKLVDDLLTRPQYGERWGRMWLDVVRYSDTAGDNSDFPIPQMYKYRNWVIDAFNRDLPYDQFVTHQLAGDLVEDDNDPARVTSAEERERRRQQRIIATGYIANSRRFGSRVHDYPQHLTIEDTLDNLGRTFLGTTINCARCHNHKFDPITTDDYYALYGIFHSTQYPWPGIELEQRQRDLVPLASADEIQLAERAREQTLNDLQAKVTQRQAALDALKGKPEDDPARQQAQKDLAAAERAYSEQEKTPPAYELAYAVAESNTIEDSAIQMKGNPERLGVVVPRRFVEVLGGERLETSDRSSGRLALARWITDPANPLTARVMVNRIWQGHLGRGIVPTPNDFGRQGKPPSHPELLDWLATKFIESGWSMRALHREIVLSRAYRMSSIRSAESIARDPNNVWLSSFPRRRLDAEAIRDTLLSLGGHLDLTMGEAHPFPEQKTWKFTQHRPFKAIYETNRRSVYLMTQRIQRHPYLAIFDGADPSTSTPARLTSTTPLQALYLLNDEFVHQQAQGWSARLSTAATPAERINLAFQMALGRPAQQSEVEAATQLVEQVGARLRSEGHAEAEAQSQAWDAFCRAVFRLNEFVYID